MIREMENNQRLLVLHLWVTNINLEPGGVRVYVGTLAELSLRQLPLMSFPATRDHFNEVVALTHSNLTDLPVKSVVRPRQLKIEHQQKDVDVLLVI